MINWDLVYSNVIQDGLDYLMFCIYLYFLRYMSQTDYKFIEWFDKDWWAFVFRDPIIASFGTLVTLGLMSTGSETEDGHRARIDFNWVLSIFLTFFIVGVIIQVLRWRMAGISKENIKETDKYG